MLRIDTVRQLTVPTNRSFRLPMGRFSACGGGTIELTCPDKDVAHAIYKAVSWERSHLHVQGSSSLGQRFCACFVLKFALQRGEGEKRGGVQSSKQTTLNF